MLTLTRGLPYIVGAACGLLIGLWGLVENATSAIVPLFLHGCLVLMLRVCRHSWAEPSVLFCVFWFLNALLPVLFAPDYVFGASGYWWILASCIAVSSGNLVSYPLVLGSEARQVRQVVDNSPRWVRRRKILRRIVVFSIIVGCLYAALLFRTYQGRIDSAWAGLAAFAHLASIHRYSGGLSLPVGMQLMLVFVYSGPLFSGMLFGMSSSGYDRAVAFASLLPALVVTLIHTARAVVLWAVILWVSSYLAYRVTTGTDRSLRVCFRTVTLSVVACSLVVLLFAVVQLLRGGVEVTLSNVLSILVRFRPYFFGHVAAFSSWFRDSFPDFGPTAYGARTLGGLLDLIGIAERKMGVYTEFTVVSPQGDITNVFTVFRGLLEDFGIFGSLLALFALGSLSGHAYYRVRNKQRARWIPILVASYMFTLWPVVSIFTYNSILAAWCLFVLYYTLDRE